MAFKIFLSVFDDKFSLESSNETKIDFVKLQPKLKLRRATRRRSNVQTKSSNESANSEKWKTIFLYKHRMKLTIHLQNEERRSSRTPRETLPSPRLDASTRKCRCKPSNFQRENENHVVKLQPNSKFRSETRGRSILSTKTSDENAYSKTMKDVKTPKNTITLGPKRCFRFGKSKIWPLTRGRSHIS